MTSHEQRRPAGNGTAPGASSPQADTLTIPSNTPHRGPDAPVWDYIVDSSTLSFSAGYELGLAHGYRAGQADAHRDDHRDRINTQASRAMIANHDTMQARARARTRQGA